ncbi:hypothetical protein [Pseudomonas silesiensis]|uniref:hypothetical protein n=1 Tax=Pseudomonas silesiensis TaxID=1853130 RepID=UPI0034D644A8
MNKLLIRAHVETTVLDFPLTDGNLTSRPELALVLDTKSMSVFAYAVVQSHDIGKAVVSALRKGYNASLEHSDTALNYSIDCVSVNAVHRRNARIEQAAIKLGMTLVNTPPRPDHGRIEALVHNLSAAKASSVRKRLQ